MKSKRKAEKTGIWMTGVVTTGVIIIFYALFILLFGYAGHPADTFRISLASLLLVSGIGILRRKNWSRFATAALLSALMLNWMSYVTPYRREAFLIVIFEICLIVFLFLPGVKNIFK